MPLGHAISPTPEFAPPKHSSVHYLWAVLIASIYEVFPLLCLLCGGQMRLIAFIIEGTVGVSTWSEGFSKGRYLASCGRNAYPFTRTSIGNGAKVKTGKPLWIKDV